MEKLRDKTAQMQRDLGTKGSDTCRNTDARLTTAFVRQRQHSHRPLFSDVLQSFLALLFPHAAPRAPNLADVPRGTSPRTGEPKWDYSFFGGSA